MIEPLGFQATLVTNPECPLSTARSKVAGGAQSRTVPSHEPVASVRPSGLHATVVTAFVCPLSADSGAPLITAQSWTTFSLVPPAGVSPSGLNATEMTLRPLAESVRRSRLRAISQR